MIDSLGRAVRAPADAPGGGGRSTTDAVLGFTKSVGAGLRDGVASTAAGLASMAKGAAAIVTEPQARTQAWNTVKHISEVAVDYGAATLADPAKPFHDAQAGVLAVRSAFDQAHAKAVADGREAEFWGNALGRTGFEVGTLLIPFGAAAKAGKLGTTAKTVEVTAAAAKTPAVLDRVKRVVTAPALAAVDSAPAAIAKCPRAAGSSVMDMARIQSELAAIYKIAPEAKAEIDSLAGLVAAKHQGRVAAAPLKSVDRAVEKIVNDYGGDVSRIKDIARNTIVVPAGQEEAALQSLRQLQPSILDKHVKVVDGATDECGYSGRNISVPTKNGLIAEIQINSPEMIYAKETPEVAQKILGGDVYAQIERESGQPGGLGHQLYEKWRSLPVNSPEGQEIAARSRAYYNSFRK